VTPPVLHEAELDAAALEAAVREWGGCFVEPTCGPDLLARTLEASRWFFALPRAAKAAVAIERSPHFRGWSEMHNERDWREQLHLGRERPAADGGPAFRRLEGPNLWPNDATWRALLSRYTGVAAALGERILRRIAGRLGVDPACLGAVGSDGYLVAKLIGYHAQRAAGGVRSGVAPHVDFSWVTITLQDSPGLEVRRPDGAWTTVDVRPGAVWVHPGELLAHATQGRYPATPHRVVNRSRTRLRVSVPLFVNPPLDAVVPLFADGVVPAAADAAPDEHVHRVLAPAARRAPFHFGAAEWRRKGLGGWCHACRASILESQA
jgi:isopenicillin N synthase-like dioxygenase